MKREPTDDATESKNLRMEGHSPRGNRETPKTPLPVGGRGRLGKVIDQSPNMHVDGESDDLIVPGKQANKIGPTPVAESVEGRGSAKGNVAQQAAVRTQCRNPASSGLSGIRKAANQRFLVTHPRQEPYEVVPHVRIRAGGGPKGPSLPRQGCLAARRSRVRCARKTGQGPARGLDGEHRGRGGACRADFVVFKIR